jgi:hypothetical protein
VRLTTLPGAAGHGIRLDDADGPIAVIAAPVECEVLGGARHTAAYDRVDADSSERCRGTATWRHGDLELSLVDEWTVDNEDAVSLRRTLTAEGTPSDGAGIQLRLAVEVAVGENVRFLAPGVVYSPGQWQPGRLFSYADQRLAYPLVAVHDADTRAVVTLARDEVARFDTEPARGPGESGFLHRTDIGSVGFSATESGGATLHAAWPYFEGEASAMLDAAGTPAIAYFPVPADGLQATVSYVIRRGRAERYVAAVREAVRPVLESPELRPVPVPVPLADTIDARLDSAAQTFHRWDDGFAGFVLNFDPEQGYISAAKAFGASFTDHQMGDSRDILEYGFTGRQLNLAYMLAARDPQAWAERGRAVVDSFVERMTTDSGWVHTLWHAGLGRPLFACGDPIGPVMHYLGRSQVNGTYTRMMTEAGGDLLLNVGLHRSLGSDRPDWLRACTRLADFFVRHQEPDGAWFRAYAPDGQPIAGDPWFGETPAAAKTATGAVVPFLLDVADAVGGEGDRYREAARLAGEYLIRHHVEPDEYRGGTLDNPNVVDKEAAFIAMRALLALHDRDGDPRHLDAAHRAASIAVTWHSLWEVPNVPGTRVAEAGVSSVGWGGINSVWGAGVTDIYSLFFAADLHRLGVLTGDQAFCRVAELVACSSVELLSLPGRLHGLADTGMQPEGISFCGQGIDDGLIRKGDIWGGLGWPYTAGTHGLQQYLEALDAASLTTASRPDRDHAAVGEPRPSN